MSTDLEVTSIMERHGRSGDAARRRLGRVLVVEDERDVAELIRYHLSKGRL